MTFYIAVKDFFQCEELEVRLVFRSRGARVRWPRAQAHWQKYSPPALHQGNIFQANHNHQITASSPPNAQNNPDFPASLQYTPEPLDSPQSYQYTLPCNRRLDYTWYCPEPPERFSQVAERASAPLESTKGPPMKPQQPRKAPQLPAAPPPTSICHNFSGKIRN